MVELNKKTMKNLEKNKKLKQYTENFAKEIADMLIQQFEEMKQNNQETVVLDDSMKKVFEEKGKELGEFTKKIMEETQKENQVLMNRNHLLKVTIK